ncbi:hypothetical protein BGZ51_006318 [Haplosporangium sp. Z 767]|nr:hypothetical protein BGZ51_006318 [Haplosporangium sp. Z 767]
MNKLDMKRLRSVQILVPGPASTIDGDLWRLNALYSHFQEMEMADGYIAGERLWNFRALETRTIEPGYQNLDQKIQGQGQGQGQSQG